MNFERNKPKPWPVSPRTYPLHGIFKGPVIYPFEDEPYVKPYNRYANVAILIGLALAAWWLVWAIWKALVG